MPLGLLPKARRPRTPMNRPGLFISFEGLDKSGKSTQIKLLEERLAAAGHTVLVTREPGGTPLCERIRELVMQFHHEHIAPETELLLFSASRAQLVQERIRPALQAGQIVLCDRFADSTVAYQGFARGLPRQTIDQLAAIATGGCTPDLTFLLDIPVPDSFARLRQVLARDHAESDRFEHEKAAFYEKVRQGYLALARECPGRIHLHDALLAPDTIADAIWTTVEPMLRR